MDLLIEKKNSKKILFTPGPASLSKANLINLDPAFGRGDKSYKSTEKKVLSKIKRLSGHKNIITTQGSGSTVLEMVSLNFLRGKVLIVSTGYYSDRLYNLALFAKKTHNFIKKIDKVEWNNLDKVKKKYDWIWACYTETSCGLKLSMNDLRKVSRSSKSKLALDATSSFGLEKDHKHADVVSFSSCKGLLGLTGAGFICYNELPKNKVNSFVLNLLSARDKKMTGPYHSIQSLELILKNFKSFRKSVVINKKLILKKFKDHVLFPKKNQPLICTYLKCKIKGTSSKVILYQPRVKLPGSVVCHLGEAHLGAKAKGKILDYLIIDEKK
tara:strand:- start:443 stop:1423 length:981 start_codon:yes stop_codon:yes gene_type:complete